MVILTTDDRQQGEYLCKMDWQSFMTLVFAPAKSGSPTHSMKIFKSVGESDELCAIFLCYIGGEI